MASYKIIKLLSIINLPKKDNQMAEQGSSKWNQAQNISD